MNNQKIQHHQALIIGAGFSGLYQLYCLRDQLNLDAKIIEAADGVGGTWYWNRYPGARCDSESHTYCYYFNDKILKEWKWSERYPAQEEIQNYLNYCADKLSLKKDIYFNERICSCSWDEHKEIWILTSESGKIYSSKFLITAVGCLSSTNKPKIPQLSAFEGEIYYTGEWPHKNIEFRNKSVAVIGTGSSGIQAIPVIAEEAKRLFVLQRTPNFSVPARNHKLEESFHSEFISKIEMWREKMFDSRHGHPWKAPARKLCETDERERSEILENNWEKGGLSFRESFDDIILDENSNEIISEFIRKKIYEIVEDPETAKSLSPVDHPFGTKRPPIDTNYFETFNRNNVELINLKNSPIKSCDKNGIILEDGKKISVDILVFATGFDAMTGSLQKLGLIGKNGIRLEDFWRSGPQTYLGLAIPNFPNLLTITGPGSPSVLTNMPRSIEQHVDWITQLLRYLMSSNMTKVEAKVIDAKNWTEYVTEIANKTLMPKAGHSWYLGANIPGKPRVFMPYANGLNNYRDECEAVAADGYTGFKISS